MANEISAQYSKALELHNKILVSAQLAQTNLWDMCSGLKEMRDGKLYKELGYQNFEEYCGAEFNINRTQAHKYISIIENLNGENVYSSKHLGVTKLYLLSTLSQDDQEKILAENDVEKQTVKELEETIKYYKDKNHDMEIRLDEQGELLTELRIKKADAKREKEEALEEVDRLTKRIGELESRPIDVAVMEPSDDVRQLKETIKNLERSTEEQIEKMENDHVADVRRIHEQNRADTQKLLDKQKAEYEEKLRATQASAPLSALSDRQAFKAYFSAAYDAFDRMITFAAKSEDNREFFRGKIETLVETFANANKNM